jgi:NAD(P)H-hydrate repair Nnr-like enzyme with NAD(P)H-hydrate dehydratase domain
MVLAQPVEFARIAAETTGATVLLKGATTIVVGPEGPVRSQAEAPAWLATAGAGDVLSGVIGALLAAGLDPIEAGSLGAWVHGRAAETASAGGPITAEDVLAAVPGTVAELLKHRR